MAKNRKFADGRYLTVAVAGASSGDPVVFGQIPGVALIDTNSDGDIVMDTAGVYEMDVTGEDGVGNAAISAGDIVYYDSGTINADATNGIRFGYALEAVASGATTAIKVKVGY